VVLSGGGVRRGWHRLGRFWRLGSLSEPVEIEHSWALSAIGGVVDTGLLAWGESGGGLGRDLLGEAKGDGRGISAGRSGIQGLIGTDSRKVGNSDSVLFFPFFTQGRSRHLLRRSF